LPGALSKDEIAAVLELDKMSMTRHWHIQACSAVTGDGLVDGVDWLVSDVAARIFLLE
jgi:ADP-ribosylation factor-like protein 2